MESIAIAVYASVRLSLGLILLLLALGLMYFAMDSFVKPKPKNSEPSSRSKASNQDAADPERVNRVGPIGRIESNQVGVVQVFGDYKPNRLVTRSRSPFGIFVVLPIIGVRVHLVTTKVLLVDPKGQGFTSSDGISIDADAALEFTIIDYVSWVASRSDPKQMVSQRFMDALRKVFGRHTYEELRSPEQLERFLSEEVSVELDTRLVEKATHRPLVRAQHVEMSNLRADPEQARSLAAPRLAQAELERLRIRTQGVGGQLQDFIDQLRLVFPNLSDAQLALMAQQHQAGMIAALSGGAVVVGGQANNRSDDTGWAPPIPPAL